MYTHPFLEESRIPRTTALTIRLKTEIRKKVEHYSDVLRLPPSTLCALVLEEKLEEWVKEYAKRVYEDVSKL